MKKETTPNDDFENLRKKAEHHLRGEKLPVEKINEEDILNTLHELRVHQIELEMQNEELRLMQEKLEESRSKYADLYDFAPVGYFTLDAKGLIIEANLTGCQMLRVERSNLIKKPFHLFVDKENQDDFYLHHKAALTAGLKPTCEITLIRKDKEKFQARLDSTPVIKGDEKIESCRISIIDITEQVYAQQQVINLAKFPAEDPFPVLRINEDGTIIYSNKPGEVLLEEWKSQIGKKAPQDWRSLVTDALHTGQYFVKEVNCGEKIFSFAAAPVFEGRYVNLYGRDLTKTRQIQTLLAESEKKYRRLFNTMSEGFALNEIICDEKGKPCDYRFLEVNSAFETLTGLKAKDVEGKTIKEAVPGIEQFWIDEFGKVALTGKSKNFENFSEPFGKYYEVFAYRPAPMQFAVIFLDITERKKMEEAVHQSEEKYRTIFETTNEGIWITDGQRKTVLVNKRMEEMLGYSADELIGKIPAEFLAPGQEKTVMETRKNLQAGESTLREFRFHRKNGSDLWVISSAAPVFDNDGRMIRTISMITDITERKQAEESLRRSSELSSALNAIDDIVYSTLDSEGIMERLVYDGACVLSSETAALSLRKQDGWLVHYVYGMPEDAVGTVMDDSHELHAALAIETKEPVAVTDAFNDERFNMEHLRKYNIHSVLVLPLIIRDKALGVIFFNYHSARHTFTPEEITFARQLSSTASIALENARLFDEQKKTAAILFRQAQILSQVHDAVVSTDLEGIITSWNIGAENMFGYSEKEALGKHISIIHPPEQRGFLEKQMIGELKKKGNLDLEVRHRKKTGEVFWSILSLSTLKDEKGDVTGMIGYALDITERKQAEDALRKSNEELSRFNRVAVGRELRMIQLKKEINNFCGQAGLPPRYPLDFEKENENEKNRSQTT